MFYLATHPDREDPEMESPGCTGSTFHAIPDA